MIKDLGTRRMPNGKMRRYGMYQCLECYAEVERESSSVKYSMKNKRTTGCSLCSGKRIAEANTKYSDDLDYILYRRFLTIKGRCYIKSAGGYSRYGAKGITICDEWLNSPKAFMEWAKGNGYQEGLHLDKDILCRKLDIYPQVYSPQTCLWVTPKENVQEAVGISVAINGKVYKSISEASRETGISQYSIRKKYVHG